MSKCVEQVRIGDLVLRRALEGLDPDQAASLERHLATCPECARSMDRLTSGLGALRSLAVMAPPWLATTTARRLRVRLEERREAADQAWLIGSSAVAAFALGAVATACLWAGLGALGLSEALRLVVMAFAWLLPPTAAVLALALVRPSNGLDLMRARSDARSVL